MQLSGPSAGVLLARDPSGPGRPAVGLLPVVRRKSSTSSAGRCRAVVFVDEQQAWAVLALLLQVNASVQAGLLLQTRTGLWKTAGNPRYVESNLGVTRGPVPVPPPACLLRSFGPGAQRG
jgi:hypothetical protein